MKRFFVGFAVFLFPLLGGRGLAAPPIQWQQFQPQWNVGDQWIVQTQTAQPQVAGKQSEPEPLQWQFSVQKVEQVGNRQCYRVVVKPTDTPHPQTVFWVDRDTKAIQRLQTELPVQGGFKTVTENYKGDADAAPVLGPMTVLPIGLPQFAKQGLKGPGTYQYQTHFGADGIKSPGDVGFSTEIRQKFSRPSSDRIKSILPGGIKSGEERRLVEVELATPTQKVRQVWEAGTPWPLFTENAVTKARLIEMKRGKPDESPRNDRKPVKNGTIIRRGGIKESPGGGSSEQATANLTPWSGYWWPIHEGKLLGPLAKYDRITGRRAAEWERGKNPPGPNVPHWFGYCHAWSAASVLEKEPNRVRAIPAGGGNLQVDVGDQKGMLTACHTRDAANSWGDRYGDGQGSEDPQDLAPDVLWRLLKMHVKQQGVPLILDVEAGDEVWNYPVYHYSLTYRPANGAYQASLTLYMADDAVLPNFQGTQPRKQTLQFSFQMNGGNVVEGSGRWIGASVKDHPDFAWYPYKAVAVNPEIEYSEVQRIVGGTALPPSSDGTPGPGTTPPSPPSDDTPNTPPAPTTPATPGGSTPPPTTPSTPGGSTTPPPTTPSTPGGATTPPPTTPSAPGGATTPPPTTPSTPGGSPPPPTTPSTPGGATTPPPSVSVQPPSGQADAPIVLSPLELAALVANRTSSFGLDATVDRSDGASYRPGESFFVRVNSAEEGYLTLLQIDSNGMPSLLCPFSGQSIRIPAGKSVVIRPKGSPGFPVFGPAGVVRVKAIVTTRPLLVTGSPAGAQYQGQDSGQGKYEPQAFRWHPTQLKQIQKLLASGASQKELEALGCPTNPEEFLGPFAQDVTTFYVDAGKSVPGKQ